MKTMYVGEFKYALTLSEITIQKETEKTITVKNQKMIYGNFPLWFGKRTLKSQYNFFDTLNESLVWASQKTKKRIEDHQSSMEKLKRLQQRLLEMRE